MAQRLRLRARSLSLFAACALALLAGLAGTARADVWAYMDEDGRPRFAADKVDARYDLFFRGNGMPLLDSPDDLALPRVVPVPTAPPKLTVFFEVSPNFKQVKHHLREASNTYNIDIELLQALIAAESGFDAQAISPKGATGLMQLMPATAQRFGVQADANTTLEQKLFDPKTNVQAGTRYLRYLFNLFPGRLDLALAAYNAGEGAVLRAGKRIPNYKETQDYVKTVSNIYAWLKPPTLLAEERRAASTSALRNLGGPPAGGAQRRGNMPRPLPVTDAGYATFQLDTNLSKAVYAQHDGNRYP